MGTLTLSLSIGLLIALLVLALIISMYLKDVTRVEYEMSKISKVFGDFASSQKEINIEIDKRIRDLEKRLK